VRSGSSASASAGCPTTASSRSSASPALPQERRQLLVAVCHISVERPDAGAFALGVRVGARVEEQARDRDTRSGLAARARAVERLDGEQVAGDGRDVGTALEEEPDAVRMAEVGSEVEGA
jgi:hypothetical protein